MKKSIIVVCFLCVIISACSLSENKQVRFSAVYLDLDGTSLGSNHEIRPETIKAISNFEGCGGKIGIVTGRTLSQVTPYLNDIKPSLPIVLSNGGVVFSSSGKDILRKITLPKSVTQKALAVLTQNKNVVVNIVMYPKKMLLDNIPVKLAERVKKWGVTSNDVCSNLIECVNKYEAEKNNRSAINITLLVEDGHADEIKKSLEEMIGNDASILVSGSTVIQLVPKGVDKGNALKEIIKDKNLDKDDVIVFGDSGNDVGMLSYFPVSFAMGNCTDGACKSAAFIIGSNDTDAIAQTFNRLIMLPSCLSKNSDL
ncbi:MAG: HAD family hydrolase [Pseudomonadota bacterium]